MYQHFMNLPTWLKSTARHQVGLYQPSEQEKKDMNSTSGPDTDPVASRVQGTARCIQNSKEDIISGCLNHYSTNNI